MRPKRVRAIRAAILAVAAASVPIGGVQAQYFGRNRVQYEHHDFQVLQTEHFDIHYYPGEDEAARLAGVMAERWYERISTLFNHQLRGRQVVIYYADHPDFEQTNAIGSTPGEGTGGVTEVFKRRIVLPFAGPLRETDHVLGHELVHAFQYDMTGQGKVLTETTAPTAVRLPLWFIEGMAEYISVGPNDPNTAMWIRDALANDRLPSARQLYNPDYFPYRFGQAFWAYVAGRWGDDVVPRILNAAGRRGSAEAAIENVLRVPMDSLIEAWHEAITAAYSGRLASGQAATSYGTPLLTKANSGRVNVAPVLSPDGKRVMFLSEKDQFAIEMFLADAVSGQVQRKIVKTAVDPHYESLEFINSAGAWAPDNRRFVFGAVTKGKAVLSIRDADTGALVRERQVEGVGEIKNPAWSPDGRMIAFSALAGGLTDLFVYDVDRDEVRRLTNDVYADLEPAWSPDGRKLVFVTDRFSSDLRTYAFGEYRLGQWDAASGAIEALPFLPGAKHINPQWGEDGQSVFFVSDWTGVSNIYRLDLASADVYQVTDISTGVSGITDLSPAISVARGAEVLVFSVFEDGGYNVYRSEDASTLRGHRVTSAVAGTEVIVAGPSVDASAGVLPPFDRTADVIEDYLANPTGGLVDDSAFSSRDYHAKLSVDYVSQPYLSFGADQYGAFLGAGVSAYWSDMLGGHHLATQFQVQGGPKDIGAVIGYTNLTHRWDWQLVAGQIPYLTGYTAAGLTTDAGGRLVYVEQQQLIRQYNRQLSGLLSYPFSRVQRMEFTAGVRSLGFGGEVRTRVTDAMTGQLLQDSTRSFDVCFTDPRTLQQICQENDLFLAHGGVALVYDNAIFGGTGPVLGQRFRVEVGPNVGSLTYVDAIADFRRYLMPLSPITLAGRVTHYGRYGPDAEEPILSDLYLGTTGLVRGYRYNSFTASECLASADAASNVTCPVQDQLFGSRIAVGGLELRLPPSQLLGMGSALFGAVAIDLIAFGDVGVAWESDHEAFFLGGNRDPVTSTGVGLRFNFLNVVIGELDYVYPFQRPDKGWHWQFSFTPGY